ncbi:DUF885 domain-containing protein [Spongiimicrobium sp. 3-5]|uniref:DUF885 domain-containing protein n=1 Tax=Spongiimicrobium sp. 3-5 TaxID=3332596 RepID=UPI00397EADA6
MKILFSSLGLLLLFFTSCKEQKSTETASLTVAVDSLFREYYEFKKAINPIEATKAGYAKYNDTIANYVSDEYQRELIEKYTSFLTRLKSIELAEVSPSQALSLRVMQWDCQIKKEGLTNELVTIASPVFDLPTLELLPLGQIQSLHLYVAQLAGGTSVQPFGTPEDYDNWLSRLEDYLTFLDTCIVKMKEGMAKGVVLPKTLTKKMIPQLDGFVNTPIKKHHFYTPITLLPEYFTLQDKDRITAEYEQIIGEKLIPKYTELKDFLEITYLPASRAGSGIGTLPNGPETYQYLVKLHTTTNMTPDEIHELGKSEVKRILGEMENAKKEIGFKGDIKAFFNHVRTSKTQMPFETPEEVLADFELIHKKMTPELGKLFSTKPKAGFEIRRTEAFREASASAEYVPGSKDAARSGIFYVPIPDVKTYNKYSNEALFLHEAIPGHHYQLSLQQENTDLPEFLHPESMGVFVEGWALYAESLGKELGLYQDPYQYFGMLSMEMHRAIRLVVDTGLHAKGWSREEAIQYSLDHEAESEASITAEIERYMATPGQALSYKIGQLKIRELRSRAEKALGEAFKIMEFHDQVLNSGSLPLVLLEEKIEYWMAGKLDKIQ